MNVSSIITDHNCVEVRMSSFHSSKVGIKYCSDCLHYDIHTQMTHIRLFSLFDIDLHRGQLFISSPCDDCATKTEGLIKFSISSPALVVILTNGEKE